MFVLLVDLDAHTEKDLGGKVQGKNHAYSGASRAQRIPSIS